MAVNPEIVCRVAAGFLIFSATATGLPQRLRADRAGGRVSPRVDPKWFWPLMAISGLPVALTGIAFVVDPRWVDFAQANLPWGARLAGAPAGVAALALFRWMFRHLGLNVTSTSMPRRNATLVLTGPYRWIRHPMYSATLIMIVAWTLLTANLVVATGGIGVFALMAARSRTEERRLVEKFGEAYRAYQSRTGRFLPRLSSEA
jgi:protein-S-isoprenylcysteine O-methyltransferase Ste14